MRLHILYQAIDEPWGGSNTFFRNFIREAEKDSSVELTKKPEQADALLTAGHYCRPGKLLKMHELRNLQSGRAAWHPLGFLSHQKRKKIIFRVDGLRKVYSKGTVPADEVLLRHLPYADGIIYQSEFSRKCFDSMNAVREKPRVVIPNGTNQEVFFASGQSPDFSKEIKLISNGWSTNLRKGFEMIAAFSHLKNVMVQHIGRWPDGISKEKVELLGPRKENEIGPILRQAHFLLFPSENEACPNVVVEALACGLPVLYHPSGGTAEMVRVNEMGMPLPLENNNREGFNQFLDQAVSRYTEMTKKISDHRDDFYFSKCYQIYKDFFQRILND